MVTTLRQRAEANHIKEEDCGAIHCILTPLCRQAKSMLLHRSRTHGGAETEPIPPADPPPPEDMDRDRDEQDDKPAKRDDGTEPNSEAG